MPPDKHVLREEMGNEAPNGNNKDSSKKEKAVVEGEHYYEVGFPSTVIDKASGKGRLEVCTETVPREIPVAPPPFGQALMDVHKIEFFNRKVVHRSIHGEISFLSEYGDLMLFNRGKENPQEIRSPQGGLLSLVGPQYAIQAWDGRTFGVDLWDGEKQVVEGTVTWGGMYFDPTLQFDCPHCVEFLTKEAGVYIHLVAYSNAVVANVEFKLRKRSKKNHTSMHNLHGRISSSNSELPYVETVLFDKKDDESILVGNGDLIPLMRSVIAVPVDASLQFEVYLPLLTIRTLSCEVLACKDHGVDVKTLSGEYGKLDVIVTWERLCNHIDRIKKLG